MILVIGGRSKIGSALLDELSRRGEAVRALIRSGERGDFPSGVEVVVGDLSDRPSLDDAMVGIEKVFLLCGPREDEVALNRNAIDAAASGRVHLLVRSSILGADPHSPSTFIRDHGLCDAYLRESNLSHTIVRPNMLMQNVPDSTMPSIGPDGVFYGNAGPGRISMVDTRDVAAVAAVLLTQTVRASELLDVTGPEALTYHDVAERLSTTLGRPVSYVEAPDEAVRRALSGLGIGDWMASGLVELFQDYRRSGEDGYAAQVTDAVLRLTGQPARSLDQLLAEQPVPSA
ncbi:MAG: SDR family oxidoreductase [Solirubrobacterales bacterium]|nr:SDR family oxidoreductase [Solirubrobacterales bacterium]